MLEKAQTRRSSLLLLLGALLVAGLATAHAYVIRQGFDYTGPLLILDHLFDLVATLGLVAICTGLGRFTLNRLRVEFGYPLDDLLFATAIGTGVLSTVLLALGLLGGYEPWIIAALILVVAALSWRELVGVPALAGAALGSLKRRNGERAYWRFGITVFVVAIVFMLVLAVAPPVDWDALMYHLRLPDQYLEAGRIYLPDDTLHAANIGLIHQLYLPLLAMGSIAGPAILSVIFAAMLGLTVYSLCVRLLDVKTALLSLGLLWGTTMIFLVAISPRVDVTSAFFLLLAHYAVLLAFVRSGVRQPLLLAAALLGFAVGVKLTALPYVVCLIPIAMWAAVVQERSFTGSFRLLVAFGFVFAAASLPWLLKNWLILGAPLYPHFTRQQLARWLVPLYGSYAYPRLPKADVTRFAWQDEGGMNLLDGFFAPGRLALESEGFLYFLNPVLLILPFALLFIKNKTVTRLAIPAILYPLVVLFFLSKPNLRYLLPSVAPLTIVVAFMMVKLSERFLPRVAGRRLVIALAFVALGPTIVGSYLTLRGQAFPHLIGVSSANDYMASRIPWVYVDVMNYANNELTPDDRILMLFDARGFYFKPQVIQDNLYRNYSQLFAKLPPDSCLESLGITHVMLHASTVDVFADQAGRGPQGLNWGVFDEFEARCLEPVHENPSFVLYRVKGLQENPQRPD